MNPQMMMPPAQGQPPMMPPMGMGVGPDEGAEISLLLQLLQERLGQGQAGPAAGAMPPDLMALLGGAGGGGGAPAGPPMAGM